MGLNRHRIVSDTRGALGQEINQDIIKVLRSQSSKISKLVPLLEHAESFSCISTSCSLHRGEDCHPGTEYTVKD